MTTEANDTIERYTISGTGPYAFSWRIFDEDDLTVTALENGDVDPVTLTLNTNYTVAGVNDEDGGSITLIGGAQTTYASFTLDIRSNTPAEQPTSIKNQGVFLPSVHEKAFDRLSRQIQDLARKVKQSFRYPDNVNLDGAMANRSLWLGRYPYVNSIGELEPSLLTNTTLSQSVIGSLLYPQTPAELDAGVTPVNDYIAPYNVLRNNAKGDGTTTDDTAFTAAKTSAGSQPVFVPSVGYSWKLSTFIDANFVSDGTLKFTGAGYVKYKTLQGNSVNDNNVGIAGIINNGPQIVILGDSITEGSGASTLAAGYSYYSARSIMNASDQGYGSDRGFGYHSTVNASDCLSLGEFTTTGSLSATGLTGSRLSLTAGQTITITGKAIDYLDVIYDGAVSSGNIVFALNGATYATVATSGAVLKTTALTRVLDSSGSNYSSLESDTFTITASANLVITTITALKASSGAPLVFVAPQSGTSTADFTAAAKTAEIAFYLNFARSSAEKLLVLALGTNNIYNASKKTTPAQMVTDYAAIIAAVNILCTSVRYVIAIPPRAAEGTWPVQQAGYTHADYVLALEDFARTNNYTLARHDRSALSYGNLYADGLHPNAQGHRIMAKTLCDVIGVNVDAYLKTTADASSYTQTSVPYNSTWRSFTNSSALRVVASKINNTITLSGIAEPNGSASATLGILPTGYRPIGRTCFYTGRSDAGAAVFSIDTSGNIILGAVPATWFSLEGISFTISRP